MEAIMNLRLFLTIVTVVSAIFGLGLLLIPGPFMAAYGLALDEGGQLMGRVAGEALIALGVIMWFSRDGQMSSVPLAALYGGATFNAIGLIVALWAVLTHLLGSLGWVIVVLHVLLLAGFCYYAFEGRPKPAMR
jgi:hypothetical protein